MLAYLSRYTHRVAISNRRLIAVDERDVTFRYKDYRRDGAERYRTMTLPTDEFIRRFLLHVLPRGFHRIGHYGLLTTAGRKLNIARARELLAVPMAVETPAPDGSDSPAPKPPCPCCGGRMIVIDIFEPTFRARAPPASSPFSRDDSVVTRHGQIQLLVEVPPLRGWRCRACMFSEGRIAETITPQQHHVTPWQRRFAAFVVHRREPLPRLRDRSPTYCSFRGCTGFPKTP